MKPRASHQRGHTTNNNKHGQRVPRADATGLRHRHAKSRENSLPPSNNRGFDRLFGSPSTPPPPPPPPPHLLHFSLVSSRSPSLSAFLFVPLVSTLSLSLSLTVLVWQGLVVFLSVVETLSYTLSVSPSLSLRVSLSHSPMLSLFLYCSL